MSAAASTLVFHAGALGDHVLIWPLLRTLACNGSQVTLVCDAAKGRLAARVLGVKNLDAEQRRWSRLWIPEPLGPGSHTDFPRGEEIYSFLHGPDDPGAATWAARAQEATGATGVHAIGPPGSPSRSTLWQQLGVARRGTTHPRSNPDGPVIIHAGAGSPAKRWPVERIIALIDQCAKADVATQLIAGEVEAERFSPGDRQHFSEAGGQVLTTLDELHHQLLAARAFVGADTGPTHLSAQLGLPTLALFGPTDPHVWSPVGPLVHVLAPPAPAPMSWLDGEAVATALDSLLREASGPTACRLSSDR